MSQFLKLAVAQLGPIHLADSRESVVSRLLEMLRDAAASGCRLVVFPELALTTFFPRYVYHDQSEIDRWFEHEMPNATTQPLFDEAKKLGIGFYLGYAELTQEGSETQRYNTSILVGPDGNIIGKYRKIHLPGHAEILENVPFQHLEKRYFDVGDLGFRVWRMYGRLMGMCICNDRRWPETFRVMGLKGAELVMLGFNTPDVNIRKHEPVHLRMFHHLLTVQAAAYQNGIWLAVAAKAGKEDGFGLIGGSCIVAPTGEIAVQAMSEDDEVIVFNCDMELGEYIRKYQFNFDRHRRIEHYGLITRQTGVIPDPEGLNIFMTAKVSDIVPKEELQGLLRRRNGPGLVFLGAHLLTLAVTGCVLWLSWGSWWALPATVLHGIVIVHLFAPFHEAAHGTAFRSAWLNDIVCFWTGVILLLTPLQFRYEHRAHHQYTQDLARDPQMIPMAERLGGYLFYATAIPYFYGAITTLLRHSIARFSAMEQVFLPAKEGPRVQRQAWLIWSIYALIALLSIGLESWNAVIYWLLPRVAGEPFMRLIRMTEHGGCPRVADIWRNTRTVFTWPPLRWLAWNMAYHAEHHALAAAPFHALPALHERIKDHLQVVEHGYWRVQRMLMLNGWRNIHG